MPDFARRLVRTAVDRPIHHDPRPNPGPHREQGQAVDVLLRAKPQLAQRRQVDVIFDNHRQVETFGQPLAQRKIVPAHAGRHPHHALGIIGNTRRAHPNPADGHAAFLGVVQQLFQQQHQLLIAGLRVFARVRQAGFVQHAAGQVGDRAIKRAAAQVYADHHLAARVELQQRAPPPAGPFADAHRAHQAFFHQFVHNAHDRRQADAQPRGDHRARDRALTADQVKDSRPVDDAHFRWGDRTRDSHGYLLTGVESALMDRSMETLLHLNGVPESSIATLRRLASCSRPVNRLAGRRSPSTTRARRILPGRGGSGGSSSPPAVPPSFVPAAE